MGGSVRDSEPQTRRRTQQPDVPHGLPPKRSPCSRRVGCESYTMAAFARLQRNPAGESCAKSTFGTFGTCQIPARGIPCKTPRRSFSILMMHGLLLHRSARRARRPGARAWAAARALSVSPVRAARCHRRRCDRDAVRVDRRRTTKTRKAIERSAAGSNFSQPSFV
jgi:hypothetical protein